jgi:transaldolase
MKIFLDTSDVDVIKHHYQTGLVDGVTTNPTLMMQAGRNPIEVISEISSVFSGRGYRIGSISAEVVADTAEEMILQAEQYHSIGDNITIKVPCTYEGLKACKALSDRNIKVNVTLIFSLGQSILAAKAGASYISPFVGRCEDNNIDGIDLISSIKRVFTLNSITTTNILAASIRNIEHINDSYKAGADIVTLPPKIFEEMYKHSLTDQGLAQFDKDWKELNK